ncbi:hypothetical protein PM082_009272 [Marasmius tenuissimus]|nr:hypothetical protein PM082_009272 [Marasmius tenuissimus]
MSVELESSTEVPKSGLCTNPSAERLASTEKLRAPKPHSGPPSFSLAIVSSSQFTIKSDTNIISRGIKIVATSQKYAKCRTMIQRDICHLFAVDGLVYVHVEIDYANQPCVEFVRNAFPTILVKTDGVFLSTEESTTPK